MATSMSLMTFTPERARAMIQSTVMMRGIAAKMTWFGRPARDPPRLYEWRTLACLEVVDLVDEALKFRDNVAALLVGEVYRIRHCQAVHARS